MATEINWPEKFLPGTTDNFVSNEVYATGITAQQVWKFLADTSKWESHYSNASRITPPTSGSVLEEGDKFSFSTFGLEPLAAEVYESIAPTETGPGRLAWRAIQTGDEESAMDVYHAWVVENVKWGAVRIHTQESQKGKPILQLRDMKPNPMLNAHQDWLDGLVKITNDSTGRELAE